MCEKGLSKKDKIKSLVGKLRENSILTDNNTSTVGHGQREIRRNPLLRRPDRHKMNPTLSFVATDLELDIDPPLQMRHCSRDPRPTRVDEIDIVAQQFLCLCIEFNIKQSPADDGGPLALVVGGDSDGSGPEGDATDAGEDEERGAGGDTGKLGGLGPELGAMLGLVQRGCALEGWVLYEL